jgi:hypothetical protein
VAYLSNFLGVPIDTIVNWESCSSIPDIDCLPKLIHLYSITLKDLISDETASNIIQTILDNKTSNIEIDIPVPYIKALAPIVAPNLLNNVVRKNINTLSIEELSEVAGYIDSQIIEEFVLQAIKQTSFKNFKPLFKFINRENMVQLFYDEVMHNGINEIKDYLYCLKPEEIDRCAEIKLAKYEVSSIKPILYSISKQKLKDIAYDLLEKENVKDIKLFIHFMNKADVDNYAEAIYKKLGIHAIKSFACFISHEKLSQIAEEVAENEGVKAIADIKPFLPKSSLNKCIDISFQRFGTDSIKSYLPKTYGIPKAL